MTGITGKLFIFNLKKFDNNSISNLDNNNTDILKSNENEIKILIETFEKFNSDIEIIEEISKHRIIEKLTQIEKSDLSKYKYVAVAVLLHHQNENIDGGEMSYFHNEVVLTFLKNFTLKNKPKLFLIQACKNNFDIFDATPMTGNREYFTPTRMIVCYAARFNCRKYEDKYGSRFIEYFCRILQEIGLKNSIQRVMKNTIRKIEEETEESQIPSYLDHFHGDMMLAEFAL